MLRNRLFLRRAFRFHRGLQASPKVPPPCHNNSCQFQAYILSSPYPSQQPCLMRSPTALPQRHQKYSGNSNRLKANLSYNRRRPPSPRQMIHVNLSGATEIKS